MVWKSVARERTSHFLFMKAWNGQDHPSPNTTTALALFTFDFDGIVCFESFYPTRFYECVGVCSCYDLSAGSFEVIEKSEGGRF
jgi:hypothetical protein